MEDKVRISVRPITTKQKYKHITSHTNTNHLKHPKYTSFEFPSSAAHIQDRCPAPPFHRPMYVRKSQITDKAGEKPVKNVLAKMHCRHNAQILGPPTASPAAMRSTFRCSSHTHPAENLTSTDSTSRTHV